MNAFSSATSVAMFVGTTCLMLVSLSAYSDTITLSDRSELNGHVTYSDSTVTLISKFAHGKTKTYRLSRAQVHRVVLNSNDLNAEADPPTISQQSVRSSDGTVQTKKGRSRDTVYLRNGVTEHCSITQITDESIKCATDARPPHPGVIVRSRNEIIAIDFELSRQDLKPPLAQPEVRSPVTPDVHSFKPSLAAAAVRNKGKVKWFNTVKGFGFIGRVDGPDVFFHYTATEGDGQRSVQEGDDVEFEIVQGKKGPQAKHVVRLEPQGK
jgi:cold shock protein